jgi:single-strand DNA-binding protein
MEIITGRITADAKVKTLKDKRQLVVFSIAKNHNYVAQGEKKQNTNYYNCAYWISTKVANVLTKGSIVSLCGHTGLNAYKDMAGDYHAHLTFHVNHIDILHSRKKNNQPIAEMGTTGGEHTEDLPF